MLVNLSPQRLFFVYIYIKFHVLNGDNQLRAFRAHHLLFLALICSICSDFDTFGGGQSA